MNQKNNPVTETNIPDLKRLQYVDRRGRVTLPFAWRHLLNLAGKKEITVALEDNAIVIRKAYVTDETEESFTTFMMPDALRFIQAANQEELQILLQEIFSQQNKKVS